MMWSQSLVPLGRTLCLPFHCFSNFIWLYCIELSDEKSIVTQLFQTLTEDSDHLVGVLLFYVAKPVLDVQPHHLLHHALMSDASWIAAGIVIPSIIVVHRPMTGSISDVD